MLPETINPVRASCIHGSNTDSFQNEETVPGIEHPGSTGVIYCSDRAMANGFSYADAHAWANLGQGAPEVGPIPNAPARPESIPVPMNSLEYAPTAGLKRECHPCVFFASNQLPRTELREAVANLYNVTYRQGKESQYTYENVCIVPGGRAGLSRVAAVVGDVYCVSRNVKNKAKSNSSLRRTTKSQIIPRILRF